MYDNLKSKNLIPFFNYCIISEFYVFIHFPSKLSTKGIYLILLNPFFTGIV
jgi:hypothetical protein